MSRRTTPIRVIISLKQWLVLLYELKSRVNDFEGVEVLNDSKDRVTR